MVLDPGIEGVTNSLKNTSKVLYPFTRSVQLTRVSNTRVTDIDGVMRTMAIDPEVAMMRADTGRAHRTLPYCWMVAIVEWLLHVKGSTTRSPNIFLVRGAR